MSRPGTSPLALNDDAGLEHEADVMGAKALHATGGAASDSAPVADAPPGAAPGVVQRLKGGIEYTEDTPTLLWAYESPYPGNASAAKAFNVGGFPMTGYKVGPGRDPLPNQDLGNFTNEDFDVLRSSANVKLTRDVVSAEWVIERHKQDLPVDEMTKTLKADVDYMFSSRDELANAVTSIQSGHNGEVAIASGRKSHVDRTPQAFIYSPGPKRGKAQRSPPSTPTRTRFAASTSSTSPSS